MFERWWDLDLGQRRLLAAVAAGIVAVAIVSGLLIASGSDDDPVALRTDESSTSSTSSTTTTSPTTSSSGALAAAGATTTAPKVTTTTAKGKGRTTTTVRAAGTTASTTTTTEAPTTTQAPSGPCNPGGGSAAANRIADLFCSYRKSHDLAVMTRTGALNSLAQRWAEKMASDADAAVAAGQNPMVALAHNPDYKSGVLAACSACTGWAENVAYDETADEAWAGWLASSGHLVNIQNAHGGEYGVGAASGGGYLWFVHDFGRYP